MLCRVVLLTLFYNGLCEASDGGRAPRITLNDGHSMPTFGLGTFGGFDEKGQKVLQDREVQDPVTWALEAGYRLIDTASAYQNEAQVGKGIQESSVPRENVFVVTKLGINQKQDVLGSLRKSLADLNMTYVDLYLIHFPVSLLPDFSGFDLVDYVDTWKHMEEAKKLGLARSIGVSNFNSSQIARLMAHSEIKPAALEIEVNLQLGQDELLSYCKLNNIAVLAYTPFGSLFTKSFFGGGNSTTSLRVDDPVLQKIAKDKSKTVAQIVLRYLVQRGVTPIPKSVKKSRVEENIDIFDFELTKEEMEQLGKFNINHRLVWPSFWQDHPYYPFEKKDVPDINIFATMKQI